MNIRVFFCHKHADFSLRELFRNLFRGLFRLPDTGDIILRQQTCEFLYLSFGFLAGITLYLATDLMPHRTLFTVVHSLQATLIVALLVLYRLGALKVRAALLLLLLSTQVSLSLDMWHIAVSGANGIYAVEVMNIFLQLSILIPLSVTVFWCPLPYILTAWTLALYAACVWITQDSHLKMLLPIMSLSTAVLMLMGGKLVQVVNTLRVKEQDTATKHKKVLEFLNMDEQELLQFIRLSRRGDLSERQKTRLLGLLDATTRAQLLEAAAEVVEKKRQNLAALEARELGLSPYEREISLMILQGKNIAEIAAKLKKKASAITSARTVIRSKLGLATGDNLYDALLKLVGTTSETISAERQADE